VRWFSDWLSRYAGNFPHMELSTFFNATTKVRTRSKEIELLTYELARLCGAEIYVANASGCAQRHVVILD
jgi:hypothetical protein